MVKVWSDDRLYKLDVLLGAGYPDWKIAFILGLHERQIIYGKKHLKGGRQV